MQMEKEKSFFLEHLRVGIFREATDRANH